MHRVALYYAPTQDDPLAWRGASWLGRDAGETVPSPLAPPLPGIAEITADPRGYGFHATLKPPMRLRDGTNWSRLVDTVAALAQGVAPFALPPLAVSDIHGFLALRETVPSVALQALSDLCVAGADAFRAPPTAAELARRRRNGLAPVHEAMLVRWGYPYVFATWFFHMTLTRRLSPEEHAVYRPAAEAWFADALHMKRDVSDICLFVQPEPGAPFTLAERIGLRG